jgi:hypothetical protein
MISIDPAVSRNFGAGFGLMYSVGQEIAHKKDLARMEAEIKNGGDWNEGLADLLKGQ